MKQLGYRFEENRVKEEIRKRNARRVLIQLPEGLKPHGQRIADFVEKTGALAILSADPCYGACDLALAEAHNLEADMIIHYGHTEMVKQDDMPTIYVEGAVEINPKSTVRKALPLIKRWRDVGLATTVQHIHRLDDVAKILRTAGKHVVVGNCGYLKYAGQITGCNFSNVNSIRNDVEGYLFIGGGRFHGIGVALSTGKPTVIADPYIKEVHLIENEVRTILKRRWATIVEARNAKSFGVVLGLKPGQKRIEKALGVKMKLEKKKRKAFLLALKEMTQEVLLQFPTLDAFVNTACPRISIDASDRFLKPVLLPREVEVMLGEESWEKLCVQGFFES